MSIGMPVVTIIRHIFAVLVLKFEINVKYAETAVKLHFEVKEMVLP